MKTAHQLARELLAGPDLPVWHFDPSRAGTDDERDTSISEPKVETVDPAEGMSVEQIRDTKEDGFTLENFITISGDTDEEGEALSATESNLRNAVRDLPAKLTAITAQIEKGPAHEDLTRAQVMLADLQLELKPLLP